ncbi:glycoside hydrolase family 25 protein [Streptomyces sp. NPDC002588]|uniref:glycoside hydrolase family 25 protein n=1 Tax=Streptomyces sp. NPDC002588 TaxID=3154419 RepID=UPI003319202D
MATCRGIDVSVYQSAQNWAARKAEGVVFAFAKASEGEHTHDAHFASHITGIINAGLVPGAYHFGWPNQDAEAEAANYIAAVRPHARKGFLHWLDLERRSDGANYKGRTASQIRAYATKWIATVAAAFPGQRVGIYTSGSDLAAGHAPPGVPLWYPAYPWTGAAAYAKAEAAARPDPSGRAPLFWQFTSTPVDRSICYLTESGLRAWANEEDTDMPLTDAEWKKLEALIKNASFTGVVQTDGIAAPPTASDAATNKYWRLDSYTKDTNARVRALQVTETAQTAAITALATALGRVDSAIDVPGLVSQVKAAINAAVADITIHLTGK